MSAALSINGLTGKMETIIGDGRPLSRELRVVGRVRHPSGGAVTRKELPESLVRLQSVYPPLSQYEFPDRSPESVLTTIIEQFSKMREDSPLAVEYLQRANEDLKAEVPQSQPPYWLEFGFLPDFKTFVSSVYDMSRDSTPGYPLSLIYKNKLEYAIDNMAELYEALCLRCLSLYYNFSADDSPAVRFSKGQQGFVTVTVKNEPIKRGKPPRLVFPTDIVDEVLERCIYGNHYDAMKRHWGEFYSCIGIGFSKLDSDILFEGLPKERVLSSNDSPKFDTTQTLLEEFLDNDLCVHSYGGRCHPKVRTLMRNHSVCAMNALLVLPDGTVLEQTRPGVMYSGRYPTSCGNTNRRTRRSYAVDQYIRDTYSADFQSATRAAGDDCVEAHHCEKERVYQKFGFVLRDYVVLDSGEIEFCSHDWAIGSRPVGQRIAKSLVKYVCGARENDQLEAFLSSYCNHPDYRVAASIAVACRGAAITKMTKSNKQQQLKKTLAKKKPRQPRKPRVLANNAAPGVVKSNATRAKRPSVGRHLHHSCAITNPFCPAAKGSKWPDGTSGNTLTQQFRGNIILNSDSNGLCYQQFVAAAPFGRLGCGTIAGSPPSATTNAAYNTYATTSLMSTYANAYRVVSAGVVIRCVASAVNASGIVTFGTSGVTAVSSTVTLGQNYYQECAVKSIQPGMEYSWISAPLGTTAHEFQGLSTNTNVNNDWTALTIEISGAGASLQLLNCEWFINVEFTVSSGQSIATLAPPNPPANGIATSVHSKIHNKLGSLIEGGVSVVEDKVMNAAKTAIGGFFEDPLEAIAGLFI